MPDDQDEELQNQDTGIDNGDNGGAQEPAGGMTGDNDADENNDGDTDLDDQDEERVERV